MDAIKRKALEQLLGQSQKLSPDDFTRPGEMIPKDAGLMDFLRYNAAHFNPNDPPLVLVMVLTFLLPSLVHLHFNQQKTLKNRQFTFS